MINNKNKLEQILPYLTYLRVNFSAGEKNVMQKLWDAKKVVLIVFVKTL